MGKLAPFKISVSGSGEFPIDMLRMWRPTKIALLKTNGYKHWTPVECEERKDL